MEEEEYSFVMAAFKPWYPQTLGSQIPAPPQITFYSRKPTGILVVPHYVSQL